MLCFYRRVSVHTGAGHRPPGQRPPGQRPWVCLSVCWHTTHTHTPLGADTLPGADTPPEQTPPGADTSPGAEPPSRHPSPQEQTPPWSRHPLEADNPPRRDGHCCGRYASYWNAFLLTIKEQIFTLNLFIELFVVSHTLQVFYFFTTRSFCTNALKCEETHLRKCDP